MESTIQSSCLSCEFRPDRLFCDMPAESLKAFDEIKSLASFPRGTVLFAEGRPVRGIYILCDGRAKLSICSEIGKRLTLRIAGPGEVLGLGAALSNTPYEVTAELLDNSQVVFVRRKDLQKFLREIARCAWKSCACSARICTGLTSGFAPSPWCAPVGHASASVRAPW